MTGVSIHQYFGEIAHIARNIQFLAIPSATIDTEEKKQVLKSIDYYCPILGIPTKNPSSVELKQSYEKWENPNKPRLEAPTIVIMLPGDAPNQNKEMCLFTEESALKLFDCVKALWQDLGMGHKIIVENGPRTGKHLFDSPDNTHSYKKGEDPDIAVDKISSYFMRLLKAEGIEHIFYNFAFEIDPATGIKTSNSLYNPLLHLSAENKQNYFIVPGESVSMLSQIPLYLAPKHVVVFKPSSMNEQHESIFGKVFTEGHLSYFDQYSHVILPDAPVQMTNDDAANVVSYLIKSHDDFVRHLGDSSADQFAEVA